MNDRLVAKCFYFRQTLLKKKLCDTSGTGSSRKTRRTSERNLRTVDQHTGTNRCSVSHTCSHLYSPRQPSPHTHTVTQTTVM